MRNEPRLENCRVDLSVILVNWNAPTVTGEALRSIREHTRGIEYEVIVVDNASTQGRGIEGLRNLYSWAKWIQNDVNAGFSRANNAAIELALGRHVLLLNNDTIQTGNALGETVSYLDRHPKIGALGIRHINGDREGSLQPSAFSFPKPWNEVLGVLGLCLGRRPLQHFDCERDVDWVCGSFLMIRRECLEEVGLLDERYFMYDEDIDWCLRAGRAGWKVRYWPGASMIHLGSATAGMVADKNFSMFRSHLTYLRKNHSFAVAACYYLAMLSRLFAGAGWQAVRLTVRRSTPEQFQLRWRRLCEFARLRSAARGVQRTKATLTSRAEVPG